MNAVRSRANEELRDDCFDSRAFTRDTASVIAFFEYCLNVSAISGNGGFHLSVVPKSPSVPIAHRYPHMEAMSPCKGLHIS